MRAAVESGRITAEPGASGAGTQTLTALRGPHPSTMATRMATRLEGTRALLRIGWRDPENVAERLTLYASRRLAEQTREWAASVGKARPDTPRTTIAEEVRSQAAQIARVEGAVAGTPFFIALVPGYLTYLWEEARMGLRIAALYGRDPADLRTAGELLTLRQLYRTPEAAEQALVVLRDAPPPEKPTARRRLRVWIRSAYRLLVFGGFMSAPKDKSEQGDDPERRRTRRLRALVGIAIATGIWLTTWVLPVTFMLAMAWGCDTHTRQLGRRALLFYDGDTASASRRSPPPISARIGDTASARSCGRGPSCSRWRSPSASSPTPTTNARRRGSTGSGRSAPWSPSRSSSPSPWSPAGAERVAP